MRLSCKHRVVLRGVLIASVGLVRSGNGLQFLECFEYPTRIGVSSARDPLAQSPGPETVVSENLTSSIRDFPTQTTRESEWSHETSSREANAPSAGMNRVSFTLNHSSDANY